MGRTPDRFPGESDDEGILLEEAGADPVSTGGMRLNAGAFKFRDSVGVFNPRFVNHATKHTREGTNEDEVDGDQLDIDWNPTYYTPIVDALAPNVDDLSAHLKGIDAKLNPASIGSSLIVVYVEDQTLSTTTSTTFQTKLTLTYVVTAATAGLYMLFYDAHLTGSSASLSVQGRIWQDSAIELSLITANIPANNVELPWMGHRRVSLAAGTHTFAIQYRRTTVGGGATAGIDEAHLSLWRVG